MCIISIKRHVMRVTDYIFILLFNFNATEFIIYFFRELESSKNNNNIESTMHSHHQSFIQSLHSMLIGCNRYFPVENLWLYFLALTLNHPQRIWICWRSQIFLAWQGLWMTAAWKRINLRQRITVKIIFKVNDQIFFKKITIRNNFES